MEALQTLHTHRSTVQGRLAHSIGRRTVKRLFTHLPLSTPTFKALDFIDHMARYVPSHRGLSVSPIEGPGGTSFLITPKMLKTDNVIVYLHGGGFMGCGMGTHKRFMEKLALSEGTKVLAVEYRQFPEALLSVTQRDCMAMIQWVFRQGYRPEQVILMGDSAGGALTMLLAGKLAKKGQKVLGAVCLSGWLDFTVPQEAYAGLAEEDAYIPAKRLPHVAELVIGRKPKKSDSPIYQLNADFPPLLLVAGAREVLRVDAERAFERSKELGIPCSLHIYDTGVHAFPVMLDFFPEGVAALRLIEDFVQTCQFLRTENPIAV